MMKRIISIILVLLLCMSLPIEVNALYAFTLSGADAAYFEEVLEEVDRQVANDGATSGNLTLADISGYRIDGERAEASSLFYNLEGNYVFNIFVYDGLSKKHKKEVMNVFKKEFVARNFSIDAKQKVSNALNEVSDSFSNGVVTKILEGTKADTIGAMSVLTEYVPKVRVVLGVLLIIWLVLLLYITLADVAYLTIPVLQNWFPPEKQGFSPFTKAARTTLQEVIQATNYTNALVLYIKHQGLFYVIYILIMSLLITGRMSDVIINVLGKFI